MEVMKRKVSGRTNIYISESLSEIIGEVDFNKAGLTRTIHVRLEMLEDILSRAERAIMQKLTEQQILAITNANMSHVFSEETGVSVSSSETIHNVLDGYPSDLEMTEDEHSTLCKILKEFSHIEGYALNRIVMKKRNELVNHKKDYQGE